MITLLCLLVGYIISILIGYFGIRKALKYDEIDPDWVLFIAVFIPFVNVIWGVASFIICMKLQLKVSNKIPKKFFKI